MLRLNGRNHVQAVNAKEENEHEWPSMRHCAAVAAKIVETIADTFPADTIPADTFPADTFPADTFPSDTFPADIFPPDTFLRGPFP